MVIGKKIAMFFLVVSLVSLVMGGVFIFQGISKGNLVLDSMRLENVEYGGADGEIVGIVDTVPEAKVMAEILREHRLDNYGTYTSLGREDPNREQIIHAIAMESSLNLAQVGYGLSQVVWAIGIFMIVIGIALGVLGFTAFRSRTEAV